MNSYESIYEVVRAIPPGRVASYGAVAAMAGLPRHARLAGYALHALRASGEGAEVPWWRVVSAARRISNVYEPELQRALLEAEGVAFDAGGRIPAHLFWGGEPAQPVG